MAEDYDIFINTTHVDNTPVSVLEAMALGLPVVSTAVGGIPDLLDDGEEALLVADDDEEAMTEAVIRLIQSPELAQSIARKARRKVEAFDWENVRELWRQLLGGKLL